MAESGKEAAHSSVWNLPQLCDGLHKYILCTISKMSHTMFLIWMVHTVHTRSLEAYGSGMR